MASLINQASASGTGSVTLLAPVTNSTQTLTLPDATGTVVSTGSTAVVTAPMLNGAQTGSAPIYGCRAWVVFDGSLAGTNAPTAGGNVTSVTRTGTGQYTVNLTTAMPSTNYAILSGAKDSAASGIGGYGPTGTPGTTSFTVTAVDGAGSFSNAFAKMHFSIVG